MLSDTQHLNHIIRDGSIESPFKRIYKREKNINSFKELGLFSKGKNVNGKLDITGVRCRFLGYGDDESVIERRHGFKLLRESDRKILYSNDVYFSDTEAIEPLDDHTSEFYASLEKQALVDKEMEEITELETEENDQYQKLNESIQLGHIDTTRGSEEIDVSMEDIISIAREANLTVGTVVSNELYNSFSAAMTMGCPETYEEAVNSDESEDWKKAMERELESIKKNSTWDLVKLDKFQKKPVKCRWVFTKKFNKFGEVKKIKARLVAKGYTKKAGIDYWDTFSPVIKFKSVRVLLAIAAANGLNTCQIDVPNAFLNGELQEEGLMMQPPGYEIREFAG